MLQQPIAFRPLPRKAVAFAEVTTLASDNQIANIIGGNISSRYAAQRKRMVNMMSTPRNKFLAIIAFSLLSGILFSDLLGGMLARNGFFASTAIAFSDIFFSSVSFSIKPMLLIEPLFMGLTVVFSAVFILWQSFIVSAVCQPFIGSDNASEVTSSAILASTFKTIFEGLTRIEVFSCGEFYHLTIVATLASVWNWRRYWAQFTPVLVGPSESISNARLAIHRQAISLAFVRVEVFKGGGKFLLALGAAFLRYTIHTEETNPFFRHASGVLQHSQRYHYPSDYTTKPIHQQVCEVMH